MSELKSRVNSVYGFEFCACVMSLVDRERCVQQKGSEELGQEMGVIRVALLMPNSLSLIIFSSQKLLP